MPSRLHPLKQWIRHLSSTVVTVSLIDVLDMVLIPSRSTELISLLRTKRPKKLDVGALEGCGRPILLEFMSYRVSHHSTSDDSFAYLTKSEIENWKTRDNPIARLWKWLENKGL